MEKLKIMEYMKEVETIGQYEGYVYSVGQALTIVILGTLCGLESVSKIHQWAVSQRIRDFLKEQFCIYSIPSYFWLLSLLKIIKPDSLNTHFTKWVTTILPENLKDMTISFDGKTIRSTGKMSGYERPLHVLSAHLAELGLTISQKTVGAKSNEIPAMRELLKLIDVKGTVVVADALHCQTETAQAVADAGGDYLLSVKDNQESLRQDLEDYVQDPELRKSMDCERSLEKNGGRIERRTAFVTDNIDWMECNGLWEGLSSFGAIENKFTDKDGKTSVEWHYYISSRSLSAGELLKYARNEWSVESMHWMLDVHYNEDLCRVRDHNANQNLNIVRKTALNFIRNYKNNSGSKLPVSKIMFSCLLDCDYLLAVVE